MRPDLLFQNNKHVYTLHQIMVRKRHGVRVPLESWMSKSNQLHMKMVLLLSSCLYRRCTPIRYIVMILFVSGRWSRKFNSLCLPISGASIILAALDFSVFSKVLQKCQAMIDDSSEVFCFLLSCRLLASVLSVSYWGFWNLAR